MASSRPPRRNGPPRQPGRPQVPDLQVEASLQLSVYAGTTHRLNLGLVIVAAVVGAILGDNLGFWIGRAGGYHLVRRYGGYIRLNPRGLKLGQYLFQKHGGTVVFFGRFVSVLRTWAAFLAGVNRMDWWRFLAFNTARW